MNKRIFFTLYLILFTGSFSAGMIIPLLSGYAHSLGADSFSIGLVFGTTSISMILCHPIVGRLSDIYGRKRFITVGLFFAILTSAGFIVSNSVALLVLVRFVQGFGGAMVGPVSEAYVGETLDKGKEGVVMGSLNTAMWAGFGSAPVIGGLIKDIWGIHAAFMLRGILCLISLLICIFLLPSDTREKSAVKTKPPEKFHKLIFDRHLMQIFIFKISHYMCIGVIWAFCPLIGELRFQMSGLAIGSIITVGTVAGIFLLPLFGMIADKTDKKRLIILGGAVVIIGMVQFSFIGAVWEFYSVSILLGLGGGIIIPSVMAVTVMLGSKHSAMGSVVSLMTAGDNIGLTLGPMLCGALLEIADYETAFGGITLLMVGATLFIRYFRGSENWG
jgi:MFS family permease